MPPHVHVIDAVRADDHPGHQAPSLHLRVHPARPADPDMLPDQFIQASPLRQGHDRDQARPRHEMRLIKPHRSSRAHATALARCPLGPGSGSFSNSHRPSSEGTFRIDVPEWTPIYAVH
jgi:hypothetical protein